MVRVLTCKSVVDKNYVSKQSNMSPNELLFQWASTIKIQLSECIGLVQIGHLIEYNLYNTGKIQDGGIQASSFALIKNQ